MRIRSRKYCFTLNNYTEKEYSIITEKLKIYTYYVIGKEVGDNNTPHLQGFVYHINQFSFSELKKVMPRAHIEKANGSCSQNFVYCTKDNDFIEHGDKPKETYKIDYNDILKASSTEELIRTNPQLYCHKRTIEYCKFTSVLPRDINNPPYVMWIYGPPQSNKTRYVFENFPDVYRPQKGDGKYWFGLYSGQQTCLFDDFRDFNMSFDTLLGLLDRYPVKIESKGFTGEFNSKYIIITSTYAPEECYLNVVEDKTQLLRRINEVRHFTNEGLPPVREPQRSLNDRSRPDIFGTNERSEAE